MAYTSQTFNNGNSSGGVSVQSPDALATALTNINTGIVALGDVTQTSASITDNSGGTANQATSDAGFQNLFFPITNTDIADGDLVIEFTPGFAFKIRSFHYVVGTPVTTASKASTINLEIGGTNVTGGVISLTSAGMATLGTVIDGTAITGGDTGSSTDTISIEASSTTSFVEGNGMFIIKIQNLDDANNVADLVDEINKLVTDVAAMIATVA